MIALTMRFGNTRVAWMTSFVMKNEVGALELGFDLLAKAVHGGFNFGAAHLGSCLLDGKPAVRSATITALDRPELAALREWLRGEVE